jgi:hypothetical protein
MITNFVYNTLYKLLYLRPLNPYSFIRLLLLLEEITWDRNIYIIKWFIIKSVLLKWLIKGVKAYLK